MEAADPREFRRPLGATPLEPTFDSPLESHLLMDEEAARIVFGGRIFEGDNLFRLATSIVREDAKRILAENAAREAAIVAEREILAPRIEAAHAEARGETTKGEPPRRGRLLAAFIESTTTAGEIAAVSKALTESGIPNAPQWQLDERGLPYSIAIYARVER